MLSITPPIPTISITPAPPEEFYPEPYSPFPSAKLDPEDDGYRANRLSLPPSLTNTSPWHSSPLRPTNGPSRKGLSRDQFDSLLKVSRDQRTKLGAHKIPDLRKESVLRSQSKQLERRARFLSKVKEPSFTTPLSISSTALESPTTAHCSSGFEAKSISLEIEIAEDLVAVLSPTNPRCDERTEPSLVIAESEPLASSKLPPTLSKESRWVSPSLDEITARLMPMRALSRKDPSPSRLPNFLKASSSSPDETFPVRSLALNDEKFDVIFTQQVLTQRSIPSPLKSGPGYAGPTLHTTRADTARDMILTLRRRRSPPPLSSRRERTRTSIAVKRRSAPTELCGHFAASWVNKF